MNTQEAFDKNGYVKIDNFLNEGMAQFLYAYLEIKAASMNFLLDNSYIYDKLDNSQAAHYAGTIEQDPHNAGYKGCYTCYADPAMETLLGGMTDIIGSLIGKQLSPTYSYTRMYKNGNELRVHTDRPACEISATVCLGYEKDIPWDIYMEDTPITMKEGDAVIYKGCEIQHSRKTYEGTKAGQVFLHYNDVAGPYYGQHMFDNRPCLGTPRKEALEANFKGVLFKRYNDLGDATEPLKTIKPEIPWNKLT